jgi:hypothetical protein
MSKVKRMSAGQRHRKSNPMRYEARPGVIEEIKKVLNKARDNDKPVGVENILTHLSRKFPNRDEQGMEITIRAQLSRLPKEQDFGIEKERDGRNVLYRAA